ncbi:hypothetical protein HJC23_010040 [Cyclotella cryptica]|uniref:Pyruvate carboxyltransferase domain-containing protein n=1 Tax=Cyclotella cryptica TaxID=29204 RepID=A0ABD3PU11_9STRA
MFCQSGSIVHPPLPPTLLHHLPRPRHPRTLQMPPPPPIHPQLHLRTLRNGEQSLEKLEIERNVAKLCMDIIKAGFLIASPDDFIAIKRIATWWGARLLCTNEKDIAQAWDAVWWAVRPRIHTFIATSEIHMKSKLNKSPEEFVEIAVRAVQYPKSLGCDEIEFSTEDVGRSDPEFLYQILAQVIVAGMTTSTIPDTTGWKLLWEFQGLIAKLRKNVVEADRAATMNNMFWSKTCCHGRYLDKDRSGKDNAIRRIVGIGIVVGKIDDGGGWEGIKAGMARLGSVMEAVVSASQGMATSGKYERSEEAGAYRYGG